MGSPIPSLHASVCVIIASSLLPCSAPVHAHGDLHEAIDGVSQEIAVRPDVAALYLRRAELHRLHNDETPAEADYRQARLLQPDLHVVDLGLAELRMAHGRNSEALEYLNDFIKNCPRDPNGRYVRARLLESAGEWKKAAADLAIAIESSTEPHYATARAELLARHGCGDEAVRCLDEASRAHGGVPVLEQQALEIEERTGRSDEALHRLDGFIAREPRSDIWLARKARLLDKLGRTSEAHGYWLHAAAAFTKVPTEKRALQINKSLAAEIESALAAATAPPR